MEVLLATEVRAAEPGRYHIPSDESKASLCGVVDQNSLFASDVYRVIPKTRAETLGFDLCGRCDSISTS